MKLQRVVLKIKRECVEKAWRVWDPSAQSFQGLGESLVEPVDSAWELSTQRTAELFLFLGAVGGGHGDPI